jgi:RNA-binding protein
MHSAPELQGFQRRYLRSLANPLRALVQIGDAGLSDAVVDAIDAALGDHELVKVRLRQPEDKKAVAADLASRTSSALCGVVGHTVILYRPHREAQKIQLPRRNGPPGR